MVLSWAEQSDSQMEWKMVLQREVQRVCCWEHTMAAPKDLHLANSKDQ
jgi:hypothetical protein